MHQSDLRPVPGSIHKKKRVGRGNSSGHGTYSGRGIKGQQSRSGRDLRIGFEGGQNPLIRSLSRKRGFTNRFRVEYEAINVEVLGAFASGATVTPDSLRAAGIVKSARMPVKILGDGEISAALTVEADRFSGTARTKIEQAGGTVTELSPRPEAKTEEAETASTSRQKRKSKSGTERTESEPQAEESSEITNAEDETDEETEN